MDKKENIKKVLKNYPHFTNKMLFLLGTIEICKVMSKGNIEEVVKEIGFESYHYLNHLNNLLNDDTFGNVLEGELYNNWCMNLIVLKEISLKQGIKDVPDFLDVLNTKKMSDEIKEMFKKYGL